MERSTHHVLTSDRIRIAFDLYQRSRRDEVLIICPGFFQSKETPTFQRLANVLVGSCDVVCMDFRGHGRSDGLFSFSAYEQADLNAVLDWVCERYTRIGLLGFSLGAATAINVASHRNGIRSLVTVSAPSTFEEIEFKFWTPEAIKTGIRGLEPGAGFRPGNLWAKKERPIDNIQRLAPIPILLIHGTNDQTVLHRHSERLHQAAGKPKRLILIEGGGHAEELFRQKPEQFLPPIQEWLRSTLLASGPASPAKAQQEEGWFEVRKGCSLYYRRWTRSGNDLPLVIVHGGGEHSGRYAGTAERFAREGYAVYAFDLPGHGRSPGERGHIRRFEDYLEAVRRFIEHVGNQPTMLLGHSLGGLIATFYAVTYPETIQRLVLSSPIWGLNMKIPLWKRVIGQVLSPLWPSLTMERPRVEGDVLSHDPNVAAQYTSDPLVHFRASVRLYTELMKQFRNLPEALSQLRVPTLVLQASDDRVASPEMVRRLYPAVGSAQKHLVLYEGVYHEVLNEVEKERVVQDVLDWARRTGTASGDHERRT